MIKNKSCDVFRCSYENDFWYYWSLYEAGISKNCYKILDGNRFDVEDALSSIIAKAYCSYVDSKGNIKDVKGWLYRISKNSCVDIIRENERHNSVFKLAIENPNTFFFSISRSGSLDDEVSVDKFYSDILNRAGELPGQLSQAFNMRVINGMEYADVARTMSISESNARKLVQLSRRSLRSCVEFL